LLLKELEGLDWTMERRSRHWLLRVGGHFIGIWPSRVTEGDIRNTLSTRAAVRRWKKQEHAT
jgi:hypothetical protein